MSGNGFVVDGDGLDQFAQSVKATTASDFQPRVEKAFEAFRFDGTFGAWTASEEVLAARLKHHAALDSAAKSMADLVNSSEELVARIDEVRKLYATSDDLAKANLHDVLRIFDQKIAAPGPAESSPVIGINDYA